MTTMLCIPTSKNDDPNYRYKMPQMKLSQESRLNGVKTNIKNLPDVARALRVPESAILKYFCAEVGANSEGTTIVKGQHTLEDLTRHLDKFIMKWVCCKKCKIPEITHEVQKKKLTAVCRSCGTSYEMDILHKAGKTLHKDIQSYYSANPEFSKSPGAAAMATAADTASTATGKKGGKKAKKGQQAQAQAAEQEEKKRSEIRQERAQDQNQEVNILDSVTMPLTDENITNACEELKTFVDEKLAEGGTVSKEDILREARQQQFQLNVTREYKFYICLCSIFGLHRNIVKQWDTFEGVFTDLMSQDGEQGPKHMLQAIIQFFVNRYPEHLKFAPAFCQKIYNNGFLEDQLFIAWYNKAEKLDKDCILYDRKAEKTMRTSLAEFIAWLQSTDYDEEQDYGEEETTQNNEEEKKEVVETEAQRNQRLLIESQKRAQIEAMEKAKAAAAQQKEDEEKAAAEEEAKAEEEAGELAQVQKTTKVAEIAVDDGFDIDDI